MSTFTNDELQRLTEALANGQGRVPTEEEAIAFVRWAEIVRLDFVLLDGVLSGGFDVMQRDGQWAFKIAAYDPALAREGD